jgi:hypothetical protein
MAAHSTASSNPRAARVGASNDYEVIVLPRISRGVYLLDHFVPTNDSLIVKMPAPLRSNLILNLYRVGPASLEHLYGSHNIQRIAESGVCINY